jgi:hypothetical protein
MRASEPSATPTVNALRPSTEDKMAEAKDAKKPTDEHQQKSKGEQERQLTKELEETFPASDPPASTQPGSGITGAEVVESTKSK